MGWNDHYDPASYDSANVDSMQALARRAMRDAPAKGEDKETCAKCDGPATPGHGLIRTADRIVKGKCDSCYAAKCWGCGCNVEGKKGEEGECSNCYIARKY